MPGARQRMEGRVDGRGLLLHARSGHVDVAALWSARSSTASPVVVARRCDGLMRRPLNWSQSSRTFLGALFVAGGAELRGKLLAPGDVELLEDVPEVCFDGALGYEQAFGDLAVRSSLGGEA